MYPYPNSQEQLEMLDEIDHLEPEDFFTDQEKLSIAQYILKERDVRTTRK